MSRLIKSAIVHGEVKIVDAPPAMRLQSEETAASKTENIGESPLATAAACAVMLEEHTRKAQKIVEKAEFQRNMLLAQAQKEAEGLLEQAQSAAVEIKQKALEQAQKEGYETGLQNGRADGLKAAQDEMAAALREANEKAARTIHLAEEETKDSVLQAESKIVELAMAIADKVIPEHFINAPQMILPLVKKALQKVKDQKAIVIRVAQENYEFVLLAKNELQSLLEGEEALQIMADPLIKNDGCVVESANGSVDARLDTQLAIVKKAIREVM